jgi:hypothetical protein
VTAWLSAGAAVLTALVGAIALFARGGDSGDARTEKAPGAALAPEPAPRSGARVARDVEIEIVRFVGPDLDGPAYEFRGEAVLESEDEVQVIARPVRAGASDGGERWIASPAAKVHRDGRWETRIGMPPLSGDSFDFAAVVTPAPSRSTATRVPARQYSEPCTGSLSQKGVDACDVVESTPVQRHTG